MLKDGLYEQLINNSLKQEISASNVKDIDIRTSHFDSENSPEILSQYVANILKDHLTRLAELHKSEDGIQKQLETTNQILSAIQAKAEEMLPLENRLLDSVFHRKDSILSINSKASVIRPETSLVDSSLFTGAEKEPQMFSELKKEILSSNKVYMLVSFIKWSGIRLLLDELRAFTQNGGELFIATTSYMGATDLKAIEELSTLLNTTIKISYDTTRTRLHAKAYIFERDTGFTTAYIGSSNISNAALSSGLEWNLKITQKALPNIFKKSEPISNPIGIQENLSFTRKTTAAACRQHFQRKKVLRSRIQAIHLKSDRSLTSRKFSIVSRQKEKSTVDIETWLLRRQGPEKLSSPPWTIKTFAKIIRKAIRGFCLSLIEKKF